MLQSEMSELPAAPWFLPGSRNPAPFPCEDFAQYFREVAAIRSREDCPTEMYAIETYHPVERRRRIIGLHGSIRLLRGGRPQSTLGYNQRIAR